MELSYNFNQLENIGSRIDRQQQETRP